MLIISLTYPDTLTPAVTWKFSSYSTVRIGRAPDNDVVLYSSMVSRYHLEISHDGQRWAIFNSGRNGVYVIDGQLHDGNKFIDNLTIQLARRGPRLLINVNSPSINNANMAETVPDQQNIMASKEYFGEGLDRAPQSS